MGGLVAYGSSDEDEVVQDAPASAAVVTNSGPMKINDMTFHQQHSDHENESKSSKTSPPAAKAALGPQLPPAPLGPRIGPELPIMGPSFPPMDITMAPDESSSGPPLSPYTAERNLVRDLTLPTVPNMDLPPSPPGSPAPDIDKKFRHFLEIKKQGHHFNERLASSSGAKNPTITEKLMTFAGVRSLDSRDGLRAQYQTSLSSDIFDPNSFPDFAFRTDLKMTRERIAREKEAERAGGKRGIEFVPATSTSRGAIATDTHSGTSNGAGTKRKSRLD